MSFSNVFMYLKKKKKEYVVKRFSDRYSLMLGISFGKWKTFSKCCQKLERCINALEKRQIIFFWTLWVQFYHQK